LTLGRPFRDDSANGWPWRSDPTQDLHDRYGRTYLH